SIRIVEIIWLHGLRVGCISSHPSGIWPDFTASFPLRAFDHAFEDPAQHRRVGRVRLVLQRGQHATGNRDDIGVAAPASGGELVRYLNDKAVLIGRRILRAQDELTGGVPHFGAVAQCRVLAFGSSWESLARGGVTMDKG